MLQLHHQRLKIISQSHEVRQVATGPPTIQLYWKISVNYNFSKKKTIGEKKLLTGKLILSQAVSDKFNSQNPPSTSHTLSPLYLSFKHFEVVTH
jgi:hypothetical protein